MLVIRDYIAYFTKKKSTLIDEYFGQLNREGAVFENSLESLAKEIINSLESEDDVMMSPEETSEAASPETPQIDITKKPGRAFLHKLTGKFLAESGEKLVTYQVVSIGLLKSRSEVRIPTRETLVV